MASGQPMPPVDPPGAQPWEGDGTLHSYCYDYLRKRGWNETARMFARDAGINEEEWRGPPIEAPQGLLYEWWSVFWDVFISRSQKHGQRNAMADQYVEAMKAKREPLTVQFAGQPGMPNITLPRSLMHAPRGGGGPPAQDGGGTRFVPNPQMRSMSGSEPGRGPPPPGSRPPLGPAQQLQYHQTPQFAQPGPPSHLQNQAQQHPPGTMPMSLQQGGYPANMQPQHNLPQYQAPPQPGSAHSSPHLAHMAAPQYRSTAGAPPTPLQHQQRGPPQELAAQQNHNALVYQQAMQAVGFGGRDPESLSMDEQAYVQNQIRKTSGQMPPTPQQQYRPPPPNRAGSQRMHPDLSQGRPQSVPQAPFSQQFPPGVPMPPQQMQRPPPDPNHQMIHHHQHGGPMPGRPGPSSMHPQQQQQLQYTPSQAGSPADLNRVGSPFNHSPSLHSTVPPTQGSPPPTYAAPPSRSGPNATKARTVSSAKMSPANSKRGVNAEDPSPRSQKKPRKGAKDEDGVPTPETPRFDVSGPSSPATVLNPLPGQPLPYPPPSRSPVPPDSSAKGALAGATQSTPGPSSAPTPGHDGVNGDAGPNGTGANGGAGSRPGSSASNYLNPANAFPPDVKQSPSGISPHPLPPTAEMPPTGGFGEMAPSGMPGMPPVSMAPGEFQVNPGAPTGMSDSRPFAGYPHASPSLSLSNGMSSSLGPPADPSPTFPYTSTDDDLFNTDMGLDFAFSNYLDESMFKDDQLPEVTLS
ncbi:hypothetical protein T439DRAFT_355071 [Meredithblackwellia eburnea MCA 4105]